MENANLNVVLEKSLRSIAQKEKVRSDAGRSVLPKVCTNSNCVFHRAEPLGTFPRETLMLSVHACLQQLSMEKQFRKKHETLRTSLCFSEWQVRKRPVSFPVQMAWHKASCRTLRAGGKQYHTYFRC